MSGFAVRADSAGILWLTGEFDIAAIDEFQATVDAVLDAQREVVLDLSELTFLDSTGIRAFLIVAGKVGGGVVLRKPTTSSEGSSTSPGSRGVWASASTISGTRRVARGRARDVVW